MSTKLHIYRLITRLLIFRSLTGLVLIILGACSQGGGGPSSNTVTINTPDTTTDTTPEAPETVVSDTVASGTVDSTGGTVEIVDQDSELNGARIHLPAAALNEATEIRLSEVSTGTAFEHNDQNSLLVSVEPSVALFNRSVEITVPFNQTENLARLAVFIFDESDLIWKQLETIEINTVERTVTAFAKRSGVFAVRYSWFDFDVSLYNNSGLVTAKLQLVTAFYNIPLSSTGAVPGGVTNVEQLFDATIANTAIRYRLDLMQSNLLGRDESISRGNLEYQVTPGGDVSLSNYDLTVRDFTDDPLSYNNTVYSESGINDIEKLKSFYTGERLLHNLGDVTSLDMGGVYYARVTYQYLKNAAVLAEGVISAKSVNLVNLDQFSVADDLDGDRLINTFDPDIPLPAELPVITEFSVSPINILAGESAILFPLFSNGSGRVNNGIGLITHDSGITVTPDITTTYRLTVTNSDNIETSQSVTVTVGTAIAPAITEFTASPATIFAGESSILLPVFNDGTGEIDNGVGTVISGEALSVSPVETTTYVLTVTADDGSVVNQNVSVSVNTISPPEISSFTSSPSTISAGESTTLVPAFINGTGEIDNGVGAVISGEALIVSPTVSTTYVLTVTAGDGVTVSQAISVTVNTGIAPEITSFTATPASVVAGASTIITPVFSNGTGSIDNGTGDVVSSVGITINPSSTTVYTLTVTNGEGISVSQPLTVSVFDSDTPVINSYTATDFSILPGGSTVLTPVFSNGIGAIDNGVGAVTSNNSVTVSPAVSTIYTLTVTNGVSEPLKKTVIVIVNDGTEPHILGFSASPAVITRGQSATLTASFGNGTGNINNGVGGVNTGAGTSVNPTVSTIYILTVIDPDGIAVDRVVTVTVNPL